MINKEQAYADGQRAAQVLLDKGRDEVLKGIDDNIKWAQLCYLGAEDIDLKPRVATFSQERMASDLDLTRFPECRGVRELVEAERRGFNDKLDDPMIAAFHFDWYWFCSRQLNTRYVGKTPPPVQCTDFWFGDTKEGGPIHGSNRDDVTFRYGPDQNTPPEKGGEDQIIDKITCVGGVSSSVLCDEEPECIFPVDPMQVMPPEITDLEEFMAFMERYRDFWGPGNRLYVDPDMNFAAVEKANIRMGVRYTSGHAAITACAYLDPEMNAFKKERDIVSFEARGWSEDNPDATYWAGAEKRYRRLLELVETESKRGATLTGAANIALDHAVPFPDRICLAGEQGHPDEKLQNWTIQSFARCISGLKRRTLWWDIDCTKPEPIYQTKCKVIPGAGLESRRAEWEKEVADAGEIGLLDM